MEEERRLFYVGATRAKKNLYISVIKKRHEQPVEPSRFIKNFKRGGAKWESFQEKYGNVKGLLRQ
jgi:superfamily I DNA/RNA helicase